MPSPAPFGKVRAIAVVVLDPDNVTIREVPATPVAIMEHRGDPATLGAIQRRRKRRWQDRSVDKT